MAGGLAFTGRVIAGRVIAGRIIDWPFEALQRRLGAARMPYVFVAPNLLVFGIFVAAPMLLNVWYAVTGGTQLMPGDRPFVGAANFVTVALFSSLLAALAIAEQMRQEHEQRLQVQAELEHNFHAMPIGLFTLDSQGRFLSANPALQDMLGGDVLTPGNNLWQQHFDQGAWTQLHYFVYNHVDGELEIKGKNPSNAGEPRRFLVKATLANDKIEGSLQLKNEDRIKLGPILLRFEDGASAARAIR